MVQNSIFRLDKVLEARGVSRSTHYNDIARRLWTPPVKLGARSVGWPARECETLNAARIAGKTDDQIRAIVADLIAARKAAA